MVLLSFHSFLLAACLAITGVNASPLDQQNNTRSIWGVKRSTEGTQAIDQELLNRFKYYSEYTAAAYCPAQQGKTGGKVTCDNADTCPGPKASDTKIVETWLSEGSSAATGFVAIDNTKRKITICMRGSVDLRNWIADMKFAFEPCEDVGGRGAKCELGFYEFWQESKKFIDSGLQKGLNEHPDYGIVVTGHSLGAAAAVYAASYLRKNNRDVELYTYGQPRTGNKAFSEHVSRQAKNYRVTHTSDIVPQLPWMSIYTVIGGEQYTHISPEYWISEGLGNKADKYKVLEGYTVYDDGNASTGLSHLNVVAHVQYFQQNMYYCVLGLGDMSPIGIGWPAGSKWVDQSPAVFDKESTLEELREAGVPESELQQLIIEDIPRISI